MVQRNLERVIESDLASGLLFGSDLALLDQVRDLRSEPGTKLHNKDDHGDET